MTSTSCAVPSASRSPVAQISAMGSVTQVHVVALQRRRPDAVVADDPLGRRWIVGHRLVEQVGPIAEAQPDVHPQQHAELLVGGTDRLAVAVPLRVDLDRRQHPLGVPPEQPEAVPLAVVRHVVEQPSMAVGQIGVVFEGRCQPVGGALEHQHLFGLLGDDRDELRGAGAGADHGDALAREIDVVIPLGRVKRRPGERVAPVDVGQLRSVQLARCVDDGVERVGARIRPSRSTVLHLPRCRIVVERHGLHRGREPDEPAHAELVGEAPEVVEQRGLCREVLRPVVALGERVAEEMAGDIDPAARVGVLQPGAADLGVLLVDDGVDAGLTQPVRGQQARHAGTDHGDSKRSIGSEVGGVPRRRPKVFSRSAELLEQQRQIVVARLPRHHPGDDRPDACRRSDVARSAIRRHAARGAFARRCRERATVGRATSRPVARGASSGRGRGRRRGDRVST